MITFFTTAKPYTGLTKIHQYNAIGSWQSLAPNVEVILFGEGEGYKEASRQLGLRHIPRVSLTAQGTPLISSMFSIAQKEGLFSIQAYINADIILGENFLSPLSQIKFSSFLLVGRRWDLEWREPILCWDSAARQALNRSLNKHGSLHSPTGIDYFLFTRGLWQNLPPMAVGRAAYDNWLIYHCRKRKIAVFDGTEALTAIHQNHDYSHLEGGKNEVWKGEDARSNLSLAGGYNHIFTIADADWLLTAEGPRKKPLRGNLLRVLRNFLALRDHLIWAKKLLGAINLLTRLWSSFSRSDKR